VLQESELPLELPEVDKYLPTESGEPPLARAIGWQTKEGYPLECNTMPGFAGSSAYYIRYMDPHNDHALVSKEAVEYWQNVDLYVGGAEHATGHLIYSRFWNKFLFDIGLVVKDEPFKKLINQGMIQGRSNFVFRVKGTNQFVSNNLRHQYDVTPIHVDVNMVHNDVLDLEAFRRWNPEYRDATFILEDGKYFCDWEIEKMSKSLHNVQNPDDLIERYGADTLRLYEMFLGPIEQAKPWDTNGIEGVFRFIRKLWRLYHTNNNEWYVTEHPATDQEKKVLHKTIKKVGEDIERFSFNTGVSAFMICVNELGDLGCNKREILEPLAIMISSFAPHLGEELWHLLGHEKSVTNASFPKWEEKYVTDDSTIYPVSFNGKTRFKIELPADSTKEAVEAAVLAAPEAAKWLEGKPPKRIIVVPGKIVNVVI
jgi:leucyl-tRNA synthetase